MSGPEAGCGHARLDGDVSSRPPRGPRAGAGTTAQLCKRLLDERSVLVVDGKLLGLDGFIRIWSGAPRDKLVEGLRRFAEEIR